MFKQMYTNERDEGSRLRIEVMLYNFYCSMWRFVVSAKDYGEKGVI